MTKVIFFGTSDFAVPILEALAKDRDFSVVEAVTQPDKTAGRKKLMTAPPVKRAAETLGLPVYQPERLKGGEAAAHLKGLGAELFIVAAYGKILPKDVLEIPAHGCVNVHGSLLPKYRGASPISAAIAAGEKETGITIMEMDEKMDEGAMIAKKSLPIKDDDTKSSLSERLARVAAEMLGPMLKLYLGGGIKPEPQDHAQATYTKIMSREDGHIDWNRSAADIERFVRAMHPWPEAWSVWKRKGTALKMTLKGAAVLHPDIGCAENAKAGQVFRMNDGSMAVNCGRGSLTVLRLQLEGKAEMDAKSFLNGYPDAISSQLE